MKKIIALSIALLSFAAVNAQTTNTRYDDAKIKSINKFFYISYSFTDVNGDYQKGCIGYSCLKGTPNLAQLKNDVAVFNKIPVSKVTLKLTSQIGRAEFEDIFRQILKGEASVNNKIIFVTDNSYDTYYVTAKHFSK